MASNFDFLELWRSHRSYPENLQTCYTYTPSSALRLHRERLDTEEKDGLLLGSEDSIDELFEIPIRDLATSSGKVVDKNNLPSEGDVERWLGVRNVGANGSGSGAYQLVKKDPKCRFIYFYAANSRSKLKTTRKSLTQILSFHQVMPAYLDFVFAFGLQDAPKDLPFSGFHKQVRLGLPAPGLSVPALGRSGRYYQICYNLRSVTLKNEAPESKKMAQWSIRQAAIYHRFDVVTGATLWIVTKGRKDLQQMFKELTASNGRPEDRSFDTPEKCLRSSFSAHLMFAHWSTRDWGTYLKWLEGVFEEDSGMAVYGPRGPGYAHKEWLPYDIQDMQYWQDKANEANLMLESNIEILEAMRSFYTKLSQHADLPQPLKGGCDHHLEHFLEALEEANVDFQAHSRRAKFLVRLTADRKDLMSQHLQDQAAGRTETLSQHMEKEAKVVRIITVLTLFYLPATFVSTLFGTDVVKFQNDNDVKRSGSFSWPALRLWLGFTGALTLITLVLAWYSYLKYERSVLRNGISSKAEGPAPQASDSRQWGRSQLSKLRKWTSPIVRLSTEKSPISGMV